jgi:hypothetical protein
MTTKVEFGFNKDVNGFYIYNDITPFVRSVSTDRGKQNDLTPYSAGQATVELDNMTRTFDPSYSGSPYFGLIKPAGGLRISRESIPVFEGIIVDWNLNYSLDGLSIATVSASDGFSLLNNQVFPEDVSYTEEVSSVRLSNVLNLAGWPALKRVLSVGQASLAAADMNPGDNLLEYLQNVELSEGGRFFVDYAGNIVFRNRLDTGYASAYTYYRKNFSNNPSFENDVDSWSASSGTFVQSTATALYGTACALGSDGAVVSHDFLAVSNLPYTLSLHANAVSEPGAVTLRALESKDGVTYTEAASKTVSVFPNRTNLVTNPSMEATSGFSTVRTNVFTNPSFVSGVPAILQTNAGNYSSVSSTDQALFGTTSAKLTATTTPCDFQSREYGAGWTIAPNTTYTYSIWVYPTIAMNWQLQLRFLNSSNTIVSAVNGTQVNLTPNTWTRLSVTGTAAATATTVRTAHRTNSGVASGTVVYLDGALLEASPTVGDYFDGTTTAAGDFTYAWTGTAHASTSIQRGAAVGATLNGVAAYASKDWYAVGTQSMRLTPVIASTDNWATFGGDVGGMRLGMIAGNTYTASATIRLSAPQGGTPHSRARRLMAFYKDAAGVYQSASSAQAPNTAGETRLSVTFTIPSDATEAFIRLYNGAAIANGDVWWDALLLEKAAILGDYFDGSTTATSGHSYYWSGTPDASTSLDMAWSRPFVQFNADFGVTHGRLELSFDGSSYVDGVLVEASPDLSEYFDGDVAPEDTASTVYTASWDGI